MAFDPRKFIRQKLISIRSKVGNRTALCATSGGVDSMVCAFLAHQAIGRRLIALFIDDGLMRENEPEMVAGILSRHGIRTIVVESADRFFRALKGKIDPEDMRKAFRDTFYRVLGSCVDKYEADFLIQGTIAADIKETKIGIKSQHNVLSQIGINPAKYGLSIIEPLIELYKPEVRRAGKALGLPESIYQRMPFPGPGLACRVVGEVTRQRVAMVRKATAIVEQEIKKLHPFQALAVLLSDRATGVVRGKRAFGHIIVIRSVQSENALTAEPTRIPYPILDRMQRRIVRAIPSVTKVLYDVTPKPPSTIEYI